MALLLNAGDTVSRSYSYTQPSPLHPSQPEGCGERTGNLFNSTIEQGSFRIADGTESSSTTRVRSTFMNYVLPSGTYTINANGVDDVVIYAYTTNSTSGYDNSKSVTSWKAMPYTFTTENSLYLRFAFRKHSEAAVIPSDVSNVMLNLGSTALPYEPFGFEIPILSAGQTNNIYLGDVQSTRAIIKKVFDGTETGWRQSSTFFFNQELNPDYLRARDIITCICSHYQAYQQVGSGVNVPEGYCALYYSPEVQRFYIKDSNFATIEDFKSYLTQQYAAGTPVTVWYVLAEPTTGIVNEPLRKIGDYADTVSGITIPTISGKDTFDVETTLKPSEVDLTYHGWHDATAKEWDGSQWK